MNTTNSGTNSGTASEPSVESGRFESDTVISGGLGSGALSRLGTWQIFVLALLIVVGGGYMVHDGTLPVWALLLTVGAYLLGVGAVVKLLAALSDLRGHVATSISDAVAVHRETTEAALQAAKSDARQTVQSHTAAVTESCGKLLSELQENTGLTQNAVDRLAEIQKGRRK